MINKNKKEIVRMSLLKRFMIVSLSAIILFGCGEKDKNTRPNILWITCEDISPALGCYGDEYARTPNLDQLAGEGVVYDNAYTTAPICAPSRSCLITGVYATSLGTQHLRSEIPIPEKIKILPQYLRPEGYYCTNNSKTDYNFSAEGRWDENSNQAHWRNREDGQPFFSVFNYGITHEGHANKFKDNDPDITVKRHHPDSADLPPYFPETEEFRKIWAHQYDLISELDQLVGKHVQELKEAGIYENTIIFFMADHGFGLPRYKRWMYRSGIHVPFIVKVPDKYREKWGIIPGNHENKLISFVDVVPTVLNMLNITVPDHVQGFPFLGNKPFPERKYIYGARSRADDIYDMSRAVMNNRYIYIRNYMPHRPYIQDAYIFGDQKRSFRELNRLREKGKLKTVMNRYYSPKPLEELYDLKNDPWELNNIIDSPEHKDVLEELRTELIRWMLKTYDTGLLKESEMMIRSKGSTPWAMMRDTSLIDPESLIRSAQTVGNPDVTVAELILNLQDKDRGVRFWAVSGLLAKGEAALNGKDALAQALRDESPAVAITAAEALCKLGICDDALNTLVQFMKDERPWVVLDASMALRLIGDKAAPVLPVVRKEAEKYYGDKGAGYKDWFYSMFIGFALDQVIVNCEGQP